MSESIKLTEECQKYITKIHRLVTSGEITSSEMSHSYGYCRALLDAHVITVDEYTEFTSQMNQLLLERFNIT